MLLVEKVLYKKTVTLKEEAPASPSTKRQGPVTNDEEKLN